jgi:polyisoprenyl-phosphate glycosyltransferase
MLMRIETLNSINELVINAVEPHRESPPEITVVVPCYNEDKVLPETASRLIALFDELAASGDIGPGSSIFFVDDGSSDGTWRFIEELATVDRRCHGIKLSRNHGHQNALLAGLLSVPGQAVISLDADLQDDLSAIKQMLQAYLAGAEIVYGIRSQRSTDTFLKRTTAETFYHMLQFMGVKVIFNHADYRLLGRRVIEVLREHKETNLFLRGLIPQLGFNTANVYYRRQERFAGETKYTLTKMLTLAIEGITSFSGVPLQLITFLGLLISLISFALGLWALWGKFVHLALPGWASTVIPIYMLGGVQLLCTGIIGQYLAKIYMETKGRPRFIIEKAL